MCCVPVVATYLRPLSMTGMQNGGVILFLSLVQTQMSHIDITNLQIQVGGGEVGEGKRNRERKKRVRILPDLTLTITFAVWLVCSEIVQMWITYMDLEM